jgi:hypothetical protein
MWRAERHLRALAWSQSDALSRPGLVVYDGEKVVGVESDESRWEAQVPGAHLMCVGDLDLDGRDEVLMGYSRAIAAYDNAGRELWVRQIYNGFPHFMRIGDIVDGRSQEVVVSTVRGEVFALDSQGTFLGYVNTGGRWISSFALITYGGRETKSIFGVTDSLQTGGWLEFSIFTSEGEVESLIIDDAAYEQYVCMSVEVGPRGDYVAVALRSLSPGSNRLMVVVVDVWRSDVAARWCTESTGIQVSMDWLRSTPESCEVARLAVAAGGTIHMLRLIAG